MHTHLTVKTATCKLTQLLASLPSHSGVKCGCLSMSVSSQAQVPVEVQA